MSRPTTAQPRQLPGFTYDPIRNRYFPTSTGNSASTRPGNAQPRGGRSSDSSSAARPASPLASRPPSRTRTELPLTKHLHERECTGICIGRGATSPSVYRALFHREFISPCPIANAPFNRIPCSDIAFSPSTNGLCTFDGATGEQLISQLRVHSQSRDDDALAEMNIDYSNNAPVPTTISLLPTARYQYAPGTRLFLDMYEPALGSAASDIPMLISASASGITTRSLDIHLEYTVALTIRQHIFAFSAAPRFAAYGISKGVVTFPHGHYSTESDVLAVRVNRQGDSGDASGRYGFYGGCRNGRLYFWDGRDGDARGRPTLGEGGLSTSSLSSTFDNKFLVCGIHPVVALANRSESSLLGDGPSTQQRPSRVDRMVVAVSSDGRAILWDLRMASRAYRSFKVANQFRPIGSTLTEDASHLLVNDEIGNIHLFDLWSDDPEAVWNAKDRIRDTRPVRTMQLVDAADGSHTDMNPAPERLLMCESLRERQRPLLMTLQPQDIGLKVFAL